MDAYQPTAPPLEENAEDCWRRAHQASPMVTSLFPDYYFPYVGNNLREQVVVAFLVSFSFTVFVTIFAYLHLENPDEIRI